MKKVLLRSVLICAFMFAGWTASAEQPVKIEESVKAIAAEFQNATGVECMVIDGGFGLGLIKGLFKSKFGKEFMKDVTSMILIDYSKAANEVAEALRKRLDSFSGVLQEFELKKGELAEGQYVKCYAKIEEPNLSDMMMIIEEKGSRMYLYMGGKLNIDKLQLQL